MSPSQKTARCCVTARSATAYLDEFEALEHLAPEDHRSALTLLTHHEVVTIDFAGKEIAGEPNSLASIREYLGRCTVCGG